MSLDARDVAEAKLARLLSRELARQAKKLKPLVADGSTPPEKFWEEMNAALHDALMSPLQAIAMLGYKDLIAEAPKVKAVTSDAIRDWLMSYGFDLIKDITDASRDGVEDAIATYLEGGTTLQETIDALGQWFDANRALRIAITETTRAYDQGDQIATQELRDAGFEVRDIWNTRNDDLVDEDCAEREGLESKDWSTSERPPLHVNCRCTVGHRVFS